MTGNNIFFCDTYALIEIIGGNNNYLKYLNSVLITSDLNLMELYYSFLKDYGKKIADKYFNSWLKFIIHIPPEIIKPAMQFKLQHKKKRLSYVDCMGYIFADNNSIKFLTGDEKFKDIDNVEFVK